VERISDLDDRLAQPASWTPQLEDAFPTATTPPIPAPYLTLPAVRPRHRSQIFASAVVVIAVVLLWLEPSIGVVATAAVAFTLAPWGRGLGERIVITTVVVSAGIAIQFAAMTETGAVLLPVGWRLLVTGFLLLLGCSLWLRRSAPIWPALGFVDVLGLVVAGSVVAMMAVPMLGLSTARTLGVLLRWWDHSSHLSMFAEVVHSRSWSFTSLGDGAFFDRYPMLHVSIWSVGQWLSGGPAGAGGLGLVQPYVAWSILTTALSAALLVWASGLLGRAMGRGDLPRFRRRAVPVFAATLTGAWCLVGTLTTMADYAFVNFLLAGALCASAVAVSLRSRAAMTRVGWFVLPLSVVALAYLYPPVAGGAGLVSIVVLVEVVRHRRDRMIPMIAISAVCLIAALPSVKFLSEPFHGRDPGSISGGIPAFEVWSALLLAPIVVALLLDWRRRIGTPAAFGMIIPIVVTGCVAVDFAAQAGASNVALDMSYYTLKIVYAMLLLIVPLASASGARVLLVVLASSTTRRSLLASGLLLPAGTAAVVLATILSVAPPPLGAFPGTSVIPSIAEFDVQSAARDTNVELGQVTMYAALHASDVYWTIVPIIAPARGTSLHMSSVTLEAARMATGLGSVNTVRGDRALNLIISAGSRRLPLRALSSLLRSEPALAIRFVVNNHGVYKRLLPLLREFGPRRIQILVATH
jgi:hypothetical protein